MPSPFVDRMVTIQEALDNPTSIDMAEQQGPGYKLVRVADANPRPMTCSVNIIALVTALCTGIFFPMLRFFQLTEIITYMVLLIQTSKMSGAGICPKVFALSQLLDMIPNVMDLVVSFIAYFHTTKNEKAEPGVYIAEGNGVPGIDLIVVACKEAVDIVMDTVKACLDLDYPKGKLRIIISDDGNDPALKSAIAPLSHVFNNILYFTRTVQPGMHHGYKAGNINAVLKMLESEGFDPNPWICNLDCDMIPDREMLRILIAPALMDNEVGLVTLPQDFYNIPVNDPLHQNLQIQHQREQIARDQHGAAWCVGSGFIYSREAWKHVGGFSELSMCEDLMFGWHLNGSGFKTVHVNACHQSGLQPDSFQHHLQQRRRWYVGGTRNARALCFGIGAPMLKGMNRMQKLIAVKQIPMGYFLTLVKGIVAFLNVVCLALGIVYAEGVVHVGTEQFPRILYAYAFHKMSCLIFDGFTTLTWGHNVRRRAVVSTWQGIHMVKGVMVDHLPTWLGGGSLGFQPTGAKYRTLTLKERDASIRPSTGIRLNFAHQAEGVLWHGAYFIIVMGLTVWNVHHIVWAARSWDLMWFWLISGPLSPGLKLENIFCHLSPIWYLIKPPTVPDRKYLMYLDERTGGYRPKKEHRGVRFTRSMWSWEILNVASVVWSLFAFLKMNDSFKGIDLSGLLLPESEDLYRAVMDAIPIMICIIVLAVLIMLGGDFVVKRQMARDAAGKDHEA